MRTQTGLICGTAECWLNRQYLLEPDFEDGINAQKVTLYVQKEECISSWRSSWVRPQLSMAIFPVSNHPLSLSTAKIILKSNPISQVLYAVQDRLWKNFWHPTEEPAATHLSPKAKWLTEAWAQSPAGAPFLSQSVTAATHMYVLYTRTQAEWQVHTWLLPSTLTQARTLASFSLLWMAHILSTSFPAKISVFEQKRSKSFSL